MLKIQFCEIVKNIVILYLCTSMFYLFCFPKYQWSLGDFFAKYSRIYVIEFDLVTLTTEWFRIFSHA